MTVPAADERPTLVALCGPTASGKTGLALELARHLPLEIVSADSRQVYRKMDIGTAKATPAERRQVPHHLLDVVDPEQPFSVADFVALAREAIAGITGRGRLPLVVGGTGLYLRALTEGLAGVPAADADLRRRLHALEAAAGPGTLHRRLARVDPVSAERIHPRNLVRIVRALEVWEQTGRPMSACQAEHGFGEAPYRTLKLGLAVPLAELEVRIAARVEAMLAAGLVEEVRGLLASAGRRELKVLQTIGYREVAAYLRGETDRAGLQELIVRHTRQYAKRQLTWFRKDKSIIWVDSLRESARILTLIENFMTD